MRTLTNWQILKIKIQERARLLNENVKVNELLYAFNFKDPNITVFSIERDCIGDECERTSIGFYTNSDPNNLREWYFNCSREHHNALVKLWGKEAAADTAFSTATTKELLKG